MSDYDEMTTADVMSGEEIDEHDRRVAALLDAQDDVRFADEIEAAEHHDEYDEEYDGLADGEER